MHTNISVTPPEPSVPNQIRLLFEYTKFHIGLYATLIAALIGLMKLGGGQIAGLVPYLKLTLAFFVVAGAAGGVIASSISVDYQALVHDNRIGFFGVNPFRYRVWAGIEHIAFWVGILISVIAILRQSTNMA